MGEQDAQTINMDKIFISEVNNITEKCPNLSFPSTSVNLLKNAPT
jgi:hypothetical protein